MPRVLIVDDEPILLRVYRLKFAHGGYAVETAENGEEGLTQVARFKPDVILLDIMMPKVDGFEVLRRLKTDRATDQIPVILLTNLSASAEDRERGLKLGAIEYLVKDQFTPQEIVAKVGELLKQRQASAPSTPASEASA